MTYKTFTTGTIQMGDTVKFVGVNKLPEQEGMIVTQVILVTSDNPESRHAVPSYYRIEATKEGGPVHLAEGRADLFIKQ
jgi:hypothetical protein